MQMSKTYLSSYVHDEFQMKLICSPSHHHLLPLNHFNFVSSPQIRMVPSSLAEANICRLIGFQLTQFTAPECPRNTLKGSFCALRMIHMYTCNNIERSLICTRKCFCDRKALRAIDKYCSSPSLSLSEGPFYVCSVMKKRMRDFYLRIFTPTGDEAVFIATKA